MYICIYVYMYTHAYICIYMRPHHLSERPILYIDIRSTYVYICTYVYVYTCIHMRTYVYTCAHITSVSGPSFYIRQTYIHART